jgi:hypothetical protein
MRNGFHEMTTILLRVVCNLPKRNPTDVADYALGGNVTSNRLAWLGVRQAKYRPVFRTRNRFGPAPKSGV